MAKSQSQRGAASRPRRRTRAAGGEAARLAALRWLKVLDTPPEEAFDGIVRIAARICAAPIALISLVDERRQWFKARIGLEARETPRDVAFCSHAIRKPDEIMIVPDTARDRRFRANPLVTGSPGIRFYAGAPLVTREGAAIGTLCVIDRKPRALRPEQVEALSGLARQAVTEMELRASRDEFASRYRQVLITTASDHAESEAANRLVAQRLCAAIEHLDESVALTDAQDRIVLVNRRFRLDHAVVADHLRPGRPYENFLRARVAAGDALEAVADAEAWITARLGSSELRRARQSMNELAGEALLDLAGAAARAEVSIGALPECDGDRMLLGQVWANLIGNAFKYSRNHPRPRVEIGWDAARSAYFVRDNGIGFNMAYAEKLFGVFERLHHEPEFEGSGIGLAIAERIVKRHGGTIWANSADGAGATFWFTVPAQAVARSSTGNNRSAGDPEQMHGAEAFSPTAAAAARPFTDNA